MKNDSKKQKKEKLVKSMFTPSELKTKEPKPVSKGSIRNSVKYDKESSFDSDEHLAKTIATLRETWKEGGIVLIQSNKDRPEGKKSVVFCKEISLNDIFRLAIEAGIKGSATLSDSEYASEMTKMKKGFNTLADDLVKDRLLGGKTSDITKQLKSLIEMLKAKLDDDDEDSEE